MPSSYTTSLRLTLPATGELAGSWGSTVNTGITTLTETAIAGTAAVAMTDANYTLTVANGTTDQARNMFITLTGTLTASRNVICPSVSKLYVVTNSTTGSQSIVFKTAAGSGITVGNGQRKMLYCDGTNVLDATTGFTSLLFDAGSVSAPSISFVGNTTTGFWLPTTSTVALSTAGSERLRVDSTGNVGIGTSAPAVKLEASTTSAGATVEVLRLSNPGAGANTQAQIKFFTTSTNYGTISGGYGASAPQMTFDLPNGTAGNYVWQISSTERMRLDASGNLGIGTTSPASKLHVVGSGTFAQFSNGVDANFNIKTATALMTVGTGVAGSSLALMTADVERMRLDSSGNLGIGTTTPSTYGKLAVWGGNVFVQSTTAGVGSKITLSDTNNQVSVESSPVGGATDMAFKTSALTRMTLDALGNLGLGVTPSAWATKKAFQVGPIGSVASDAATTNFSSNVIFGASSTYISTGYASSYYQTSGQHVWTTAPSGTAGTAITFTQAMTLDASGNLGIGTTPSHKLDVYGTGSQVIAVRAATSGDARFYAECAGTNSGWMQYTRALQALQWSANGSTQHLTLDSSGNLGLGVTPSAWTSSVRALETTTGAFYSYASGTTSNFYMLTNAYFNGTNNIYKASNFATQYLQSAGQHIWFNAPSGTAGNAITFTQAMTLDASGNLLVGGTTNPYVAANRGIVQSNGATSALFGLAVGGTAAGYIFSSGSGLSIGAPTGQPILFDINGERARIDSSGNLLVGKAANDTTTSGTTVAKFTANVACVRNVKTATGTFESLQNYHNGSYVGGITYSDTATALVTSSDYRLKDITGPVTTSGAYIDSLNPVEGTWKADGSTFVGLIAHEVQEVSRTMVATGVKDGEQMQAMDYSNAELVANLIAEIQSLRARVAALEAV